MKKIYVAAAALLLAVPAIAIAHEGGKHGHHGKRGAHFERLDADKDGKVSAEEAGAISARAFQRADKNGDGVITPDEAPRLFERIDANDDGQITAEELAAVWSARYMRADADGDGVVTKEEAAAAREKMKAERGERRGKRERTPPAETPAPKPDTP